MKLEDSVLKLKFVNTKYAYLLGNLGISTVKDLLLFFPFRYTDSSSITSIVELKSRGTDAETYTIQAEIIAITGTYLRSGKTIQTAKISDQTGELKLTWFNQPYLTKALRKGEIYNFIGKIKRKPRSIDFYPVSFEEIKKDKENIHTGRIVPEYSLTAGLTKKWLRTRIKDLIDNIENLNIKDEIFNNELSTKTLGSLIKEIHFPKSETDLNLAISTLELYEFANIRLKLLNSAKINLEPPPFILDTDIEILKNNFVETIPFKLTPDQLKAINEINMKITANKLVNFLLQGDVGSGKTIIALYFAFLTSKAGLETVILCPTTILAEQHLNTFSKILDKWGTKVVLVTGKEKKIEKGAVYIGTTALLSRKLKLFSKIGAVIVDEQHRFGVTQREELLKPFILGSIPHFLNLTATPIPRTVAQAFFGDLEVLDIKIKPVGRKPVKTYVVKEEKREDSIKWLKERIKQGDQIFWICPTINDNNKLELKSVEKTFQMLQEKFPEYNIDFLHGKVKDKESVFKRFVENKTQVLLATTVIEVGVDVPNANIVIIENAERFGLAQLHQIRGRVGRSSKESWCFLFYSDSISDTAQKRLAFLKDNTDGFKISEFDLKLRGPGEIYGVMQSGVPLFKIAKVENFINQLEASKILAEKLYRLNIKNISLFE